MAEEKKGDKPKRELPWGLPVFILLLLAFAGVGISMFADSLYGSRTALEWIVTFLMRLAGPVLIIGLVAAMLRKEKPQEEKPKEKPKEDKAHS